MAFPGAGFPAHGFPSQSWASGASNPFETIWSPPDVSTLQQSTSSSTSPLGKASADPSASGVTSEPTPSSTSPISTTIFSTATITSAASLPIQSTRDARIIAPVVIGSAIVIFISIAMILRRRKGPSIFRLRKILGVHSSEISLRPHSGLGFIPTKGDDPCTADDGMGGGDLESGGVRIHSSDQATVVLSQSNFGPPGFETVHPEAFRKQSQEKVRASALLPTAPSALNGGNPDVNGERVSGITHIMDPFGDENRLQQLDQSRTQIVSSPAPDVLENRRPREVSDLHAEIINLQARLDIALSASHSGLSTPPPEYEA